MGDLYFSPLKMGHTLNVNTYIEWIDIQIPFPSSQAALDANLIPFELEIDMQFWVRH